MKQRLGRPHAIAHIQGGADAPNLFGQVNFYQEKHGVLVEATIRRLPESDSGFFGFHIHDGSRCGGTDFSETGSHYNPNETPHPAHAGDLPPLMRCNGGAYLVVATDRFCVSDIIGRTVVIHDRADDFDSQPAGNAGTKIACGVITAVPPSEGTGGQPHRYATKKARR